MSDRILAAGGVLWRNKERRELLLVHRSRYDDWCLPKGKLDAGESFEAAALREVAEETGYPATITGEAGEMLYHVGERPKSVRMFEMLATADQQRR